MYNSLKKDLERKQTNTTKKDKNTNTNNIKNIKENFKKLKKLKKVNLLSDFPNINSLSKPNRKTSNNKNNDNEEMKKKPSATMNNFNNLPKTNNKINLSKSSLNKINFYSPQVISKFQKINAISPMNYLKKYKFLFKNNSLPNFNLKQDNTSNNLIKKENNTLNNTMNKSNYKTSLENYNNSRKFPKKHNNFSKYFYQSQSNLFSSKRIYRHYIQEAEKDKIIPEKYFRVSGAPKHKNEIDDLYKLNINFHRRLEEIKSNKSIAYKKDFNIMNYQATLLKLVSKKMSQKNVKDLQKRYITFNEKNFGIGHAPRGRFTNLAEKIKYNVPLFLYERIKQLDKEKLISRYNYFKRASENMHNKFEKMYYKKHKKLFKKKEEKDNSWNKSYNKYKENVYTIKNMTSKSHNKKLKLNIKYNNYNNSF